MRAEECRRVSLGMFMDGKGQSCEEVSGELCDRCKKGDKDKDKRGWRRRRDRKVGFGGKDSGEDGLRDKDGYEDEDEDENADEGNDNKVGRTGNRYGDAQRKRHERVDELLRWLMRVEGWCGACYLRWLRVSRDEGKRDIYKHGLKKCRTVAVQEYIRWRSQIKFADYACCWKCGLPQSWCGLAGESEVDCVWGDQVLPVAMSVAGSDTLCGVVKSKFGVDARDGARFKEWLGRSARLYGEDMTNAVALWDLYYCTKGTP